MDRTVFCPLCGVSIPESCHCRVGQGLRGKLGVSRSWALSQVNRLSQRGHTASRSGHPKTGQVVFEAHLPRPTLGWPVGPSGRGLDERSALTLEHRLRAAKPAPPKLGNVSPQLVRSYFLTPVAGKKQMSLLEGRERLPEEKQTSPRVSLLCQIAPAPPGPQTLFLVKVSAWAPSGRGVPFDSCSFWLL